MVIIIKLVKSLIPILAISILFGCIMPSRNFKTFKSNRDTIFLRNYSKTFYHENVALRVWNKVFIETDRKSTYYNEALDFSYEGKSMNEAFENDTVKHLKHFDTSMLPDEWVPLYKHKDKYYIYNSANGYDKKVLSDTLVIYYRWEPIYFIMDKFERISPNEYRIQTKDNIPGEFYSPDILNVYIVDTINNISVWEYKMNSDSVYRYKLFVPKENAKKFALVVNKANERPPEFEFDPIDFKKLLKKFKE